MNELALAPTTLPDVPPFEYIAAAVGAGYDAIGLRLNRSPGLPFHPVVGDARLVREVRSRLADSDLFVLDIFSFYLEPETDFEAFRPALALGGELGARYALIMGADPDWSRSCDGLARVGEMAAEHGLACALEAAVTRPLSSHRQCRRLIAESGRDDAVICVDMLNLVRAGEGAEDIAAMDSRLFPFAQLTDGFLDPGGFDETLLGRMGPNRRSMIGAGEVPVAELLDALPTGIPLSLEVPRSIGITADGHVPNALRWAKHVLASARAFLRDHERRGEGNRTA